MKSRIKSVFRCFIYCEDLNLKDCCCSCFIHDNDEDDFDNIITDAPIDRNKELAIQIEYKPDSKESARVKTPRKEN